MQSLDESEATVEGSVRRPARWGLDLPEPRAPFDEGHAFDLPAGGTLPVVAPGSTGRPEDVLRGQSGCGPWIRSRTGQDHLDRGRRANPDPLIRGTPPGELSPCIVRHRDNPA